MMLGGVTIYLVQRPFCLMGMHSRGKKISVKYIFHGRNQKTAAPPLIEDPLVGD